MTFDYPLVLSAFAIFIPLILFDIFALPIKRSSRDNTLYKQRKLPAKLQKKLTLSTVFFRVFIALSIIALAGPRWGTGFAVSEYRRGLDTVFAVDVSRSMDIRDAQTGGMPQSRLERGLTIARESAAAVVGARFAAAIGRGRGYLAVPLTFDNEASLGFLESIDGSSMTGRSTNLESLIDAAADAFQSASPARKVIVLISDGESHSGVLRNALNRCVREGVIITTVAVGSDEGRPVPEDFALTDGSSSGAVSRRDAAVMRLAAERTGGIYIDGSRTDAASALSAHLLSLAQETAGGSSGSLGDSRSEPRQRRTLFIILAIIAYGASKFIPRMTARGRLSVSMFVILFVLSSCSEGTLLLMEANYLFSRGRYEEAVVSYQKALNHEDSAPYAEYGLGLISHSLDENKTALQRYNNSQKMLGILSGNEHRELRYRNNYNSGVVYFEEEDFLSAADAFKEALRANPEKTDAKYNLELSLMSLARQLALSDSAEERSTETRSETREIIFEYIRQQEQQQWKSREWAPEEKFTGPDW